MTSVEAILTVGLAAVLAASAFAKLAYWEEVVDWFSELFPRHRPTHAAAMAVTAEIGVIGIVLIYPRIGGGLAVAWLLLASGVLLHARRRVTSCGCFGRRQQLGAGVAVRNLATIGLALAVALTARNCVPLKPSPAAPPGVSTRSGARHGTCPT